MPDQAKIGVLGASGYTGSECVRLLLRHPRVAIAALTADRRAGQEMREVFPQFSPFALPKLSSLEAIDWVASATVERRLPDTLYVTLKERRAVAIWQNGTEYTLIDRDGRTVRASRMPPGAETLLLLGGAGAPEHVGELLLLLAYEPTVARQLRAAVWVGQRRWNLILTNGVEIWLPEEDAVAALKQLAILDTQHKLLSREFGVVDLRLPDKLYLKKRSAGEAAPGPV